MDKVTFSINENNLSDYNYYNEKEFLLNFLTMKPLGDALLSTVCQDCQGEGVISVFGYLSNFNIERSVEFNEYLSYMTNVVDSVATACNYKFNSLIEKKAVVYALIYKTAANYEAEKSLMKQKDLEKFVLIDPSRIVNLWSFCILGRLYLDIIKPQDNLSLYIKLLSIVVNNRDKFDELNTVVPHLSPDK